MHTTPRRTFRLALILSLLCPVILRGEVPPNAPAAAPPATNTTAAAATTTTATPAVKPAAPTGAVQVDQVVDDEAIAKKITTEGAELLAAKKTVAIERLIKQLDKVIGRRVAVSLPAATDPGAALSPAQIYAKCQPSIVIIAGLFKAKDSDEWQSSVATGFAINDRGAVVTCHHVVHSDDQVTIVAMTRDGKVLPVTRVIAASAVNDLAIVEVPGLQVPPLQLATDPPIGSEVCVVSHPDGRYYTLGRGYVTRYSVYHNEYGRTTLLETSAEFAGGSSGGPILNDRGAVVGIVSSTMDAYSDDPSATPDPQHAGHDKGATEKSKPGDAGEQGKEKEAPQSEGPPQGPELQMVFKECVPVSKLLAIIEREKPAAAPAPAPAGKP